MYTAFNIVMILIIVAGLAYLGRKAYKRYFRKPY